MSKEINFTIENKLILEKRDINIYHHANKTAHMISHNSSLTLPLRTSIENDFLHISIVAGPGNLENKSIIQLPAWVDFEFSYEEKITQIHSQGRTVLTIPPGPPVWQLKISQPISADIKKQLAVVTIGDAQLEFL